MPPVAVPKDQAAAAAHAGKDKFNSPEVWTMDERARNEGGRVGKLRVHRSGRTILDYSGTKYELEAHEVPVLNEAVRVRMAPEDQRGGGGGDGGEMCSFGPVRRKFTSQLELSQVLGDDW